MKKGLNNTFPAAARNRHREQGFALVVVIALLVVVSILAAALPGLSTADLLSTKKIISRNQAFYAARAGLEHAQQQILMRPKELKQALPEEQSVGEATFTFSASNHYAAAYYSVETTAPDRPGSRSLQQFIKERIIDGTEKLNVNLCDEPLLRSVAGEDAARILIAQRPFREQAELAALLKTIPRLPEIAGRRLSVQSTVSAVVSTGYASWRTRGSTSTEHTIEAVLRHAKDETTVIYWNELF